MNEQKGHCSAKLKKKKEMRKLNEKSVTDLTAWATTCSTDNKIKRVQ